MRNKKLRNTLLALALTPFFAFSATGCWKATTDDEPSEVNQTEAYSLLRNHIINNNFLTQVGSNAVHTTSKTNFTTSADWSKSNIPVDLREEIANEIDFPVEKVSEEYKYEEEYGYNTTDNTGYYFKKEIEEDTDNNEPETIITEMEVTKKSGEEYFNYEYEYNYSYEDDKYIYRVDDKYAVNTYKNLALETFDDGINPFVDYIQENETLDSFKQNLTTLGQDVVDITIEIPVDIESTNTTNQIDITLSDGVYSLTSSSSIEDYEIDGVLLDLSTKATLNFDNDSFEGLSMEINTSIKTDINCLETFGTDIPGVTFNNDDYISGTIEMKMNASIDLNNPFDQSIIDQNLSDYTGTGLNGEIENINVGLNFVYVDFEDCTSYYGSLKYNDLLNLNNSYSFMFSSDYITKTYYWDKECTIPVEANAVAPSYEATIYVKLTPQEGYAIVLEKIIYEDGYEYNQSDSAVNISSGTYALTTPSYYDIVKVTVNETEITNYSDGITFAEGGFYTINVHVSN